MTHANHTIFPLQAVTKQCSVFSAGIGGAALFSVRDGVPFPEALEKLSLLLAQAKAVAEACDETGNGNGLLRQELPFAVVTLLDFSHALVDAMEHGLGEHEKAREGPEVATGPITP